MPDASSPTTPSGHRDRHHASRDLGGGEILGLGLALALVSAWFHAAWNLILKTSDDPLKVSARAMAWSAVLATPPAAVAWVLSDRPLPSPSMWAFVAVSAVLELAYFFLLSAAYRAGDVSAVYPIARGSAPVFAVIAGLAFLGQRLTPTATVGVALIIAGVWLVRPPTSRSRSFVLALATGLAIASYTTVDQVGVAHGPFWLYSWALFVATALLLFPFRGRGAVPAALPVGALSLGAYTLVLAALSLAPIVLVAPLRETGVVLVALWGVLRLGERERAAWRIGGAIVVLAGIAVLALAP